MTITDYLRREAAEYIRGLDITPEECRELLVWVKDGNSVHSNHWYMADDRGCPMDYITAARVTYELAAQCAASMPDH